MTTMAEILGLPTPVKHEGKGYQLSPLTIGDRAALEQAAERWVVSELNRQIERLKLLGLPTDEEHVYPLRDHCRHLLDSGRAEVEYLKSDVGSNDFLLRSILRLHPDTEPSFIDDLPIPIAEDWQKKVLKISFPGAEKAIAAATTTMDTTTASGNGDDPNARTPAAANASLPGDQQQSPSQASPPTSSVPSGNAS